MMDENTPLISAETNPRQSGSGPSVAPDKASGSQETVNCKVCGFVIPVVNSDKQIVVRCPSCGEATPIKPPPAGKQYIRCPCNCLLICRSSATRVACPRAECLKVIDISTGYAVTGAGIGGYGRLDLATTATRGGGASSAGATGLPSSSLGAESRFPTVRVQCICGHPFSVKTNDRTSDRCGWLISCLTGGASADAAGRMAARCPHCQKLSSIGPAHARFRMSVYGILTFVGLILAIAVTAGTAEKAKEMKGLYALWAVLYLLVLLAGMKFFRYLFMPVSSMEVPVFRL